ncbi:MAG TPA: outer membrane beta-barrel protein [Candidatus Acidoferrales bacterium]
MRSFLLAIIILFVGSTAAMAQEAYKGDAAASYTWVHANAGPGECGCFGVNGGGVSGSWNFSGRWSAVVDFSAQTATGAPTNGSSLTLFSYLAGARYQLPQPWLEGKHKPEPFAQLLLGASHAGGGVAGLGDTTSRFATRIGGGVDVPLNSRFALRVVQLDYYLTTFLNSTNNHQNNLLVGAGVVFRWSR